MMAGFSKSAPQIIRESLSVSERQFKKEPEWQEGVKQLASQTGIHLSTFRMIREMDLKD